MAENERANIRQRQAEGIAAARARGVRFGRREMQLPEDFEQIAAAWEKSQISTQDALQLCGISESTFYRRRRELQALRRPGRKKGTELPEKMYDISRFFGRITLADFSNCQIN